MDDTAPKENPAPDFNKIDLSQLQGFSFGTQWTQDKSTSSGGQGRGDGPRRRDDDRRPGRDEGGPERRDRRPSFRRDSGPGRPLPAGAGAPGQIRERSEQGPRREFRDRPGFPGPRGAQQERMAYESSRYAAAFYPEETSFAALVKTIRASCRTIELFEIARTVLGKADRFTVAISGKTSSPAPGRAQAAAPAPEAKAAPAERPVLFVSVPDGAAFESEDAAVAHVFQKHLGLFFDVADVEVDPPKGNFQVVNRCTLTGELLGPPNYHRYNQIVAQHHAARGIRLPLEAYRNRIESVRDPEVIKQWLEKMKKVTRYTWKDSAKQKAAGSSADAAAPAAAKEDRALTSDSPATAPAAAAAPAADGQPTENPPPAAPTDSTAPASASAAATADAAKEPVVPSETKTDVPAPAEAAEAGAAFDSFDEAKAYALTQARDRVVRSSHQVRLHGREIEAMPPGEIRRTIEGELDRQRRFPLDTANALRGRLRREHFTIFKKGAKGISYVCAVKRKFRVPGQTFAESIGALLGFIEANPMVKAGDLVRRFLGAADDAAAEAMKDRILRLQGDLQWLVREGYVTEFIDGGLFAPPPMAEARKKEVEEEDVDPENFPESAPAAAPAAEPIPSAAAAAEADPAVAEGEASSAGEAPSDPSTSVNPPAEDGPSSPGDSGAASARTASEVAAPSPSLQADRVPPVVGDSQVQP